MGTSVALKKPRDDENRADKGSLGDEMARRMGSMGEPGKTSFKRRRMCSAMKSASLRKPWHPQGNGGFESIPS
jgi:hypothetical protein